ncbi:LuxR C-terminal-related transcriptional regulator [Jatrophihabitans telluris]|uniref:LuxR C-terminal-related transcriptional regulator n=1 Tax=Jatrophihabitans telluris TaxID=2038343 RepID=A0ABY4QUL8_9ACTN|nr:LuxR C-terminal-related transcriptional regulator [Jatrophihabitans telluris]UQX86942.1 LuxR C-terminal-related transcriptional regulator [Jatrophihabitans telluris]
MLPIAWYFKGAELLRSSVSSDRRPTGIWTRDVSSAELSAADFQAILNLLGAAHETTGPAEFAQVLMAGLSSVVPCDLISYNEIDLVGGATQTYFEPALVPRPQLEEAFAHFIDQHPLVRNYAETRDPRPLRMSDFICLSELRRLDLYHEVFLPLETNHQLAFSLAIEGNQVIGIGLNRRSADFSARDVAAMSVLQPHLTAASHHAILRGRWQAQEDQGAQVTAMLGALTGREREVALLIAEGCSNRTVARSLGISDRTAENHVANLLRKLGLSSRTELAARLSLRVASQDDNRTPTR